MLKKFTLYLFIIWVVFVGFVGFISYAPYKEATTLKENPTFGAKSTGNCRIVNTAYAIDNRYSLYLIDKVGNTSENRHIVTVDNSGVVHDFSKDSNAKKNEHISDYLSRTDTYTYCIIDTDTNAFEYQSDTDKDKNKWRHYIDYTYFYLFKKYYKNDTNFFVGIFTF